MKHRAIARIIGFSTLLLAVPDAHAGQGSIANGTVDLEVNYRFPPTPAQFQQAHQQLQATSAIVCDALDGQLRIGTVRFTAGGEREDAAALWMVAETGR